MKVSIVLPAKNESAAIGQTLAQIQQLQLAHEIIVVNDGSTDQTKQVAESAGAKVVTHPYPKGNGAAIKTGARAATGDIIVFMDADGQHDWQDVQCFLETSIQHPEAMIIGQPIFDATVPKKRLYGRYATHIWVWINSLSFDIKDSMCGFRVYPLAQTVNILNTAKFQPRMGFDSEILVRLKWDNVPFINLPTHVIYPEGGISHFDVWRDNLGMARAHSRLLGGMLLRFPKLIYQKVKG